MTSVVPYGAWPSPITASKVVEGVATVGEIRPDGDAIWWSESRPEEDGRTQLVRRGGDGERTDLFPGPEAGGAVWNARTRVHEYGGGAWAVRNGVVVFANWDDQRLYRVDPGAEPIPLTPVPATARGLRFAEISWLDERWLVAVAEDHDPATVAAHGEPANTVVAIPLDGTAATDPDRVVTLVEGPDFVAFPVTHGDRIAWMQWDHPNMPWDDTAVMTATITRNGDGAPTGTAVSPWWEAGPGSRRFSPGTPPRGTCCSAPTCPGGGHRSSPGRKGRHRSSPSRLRPRSGDRPGSTGPVGWRPSPTAVSPARSPGTDSTGSG
jgi:hypothetical protein